MDTVPGHNLLTVIKKKKVKKRAKRKQVDPYGEQTVEGGSSADVYEHPVSKGIVSGENKEDIKA